MYVRAGLAADFVFSLRFQSERESGDRNFAIGYYLKEKKVSSRTLLYSTALLLYCCIVALLLHYPYIAFLLLLLHYFLCYCLKLSVILGLYNSITALLLVVWYCITLLRLYYCLTLLLWHSITAVRLVVHLVVPYCIILLRCYCIFPYSITALL